MELKELTELIAKSEYKEQLEKIALTINFYDGDKTINGLYDLYKLIQEEKLAWSSLAIPRDSATRLRDSEELFTRLGSAIDDFIMSLTDVTNKSEVRTKWNNVYQNSYVHSYNNQVFSGTDATTHFLVSLEKNKPDNNFVSGALQIVLNENSKLKGSMLAYEFLMKDSELPQRIDKERKSLNKIKSNYEKKLSEANTHLVEHISQSEAKVNEFATKIDELVNTKTTDFDSWDGENKESYNTWIEESTNKIKELEELYTEKLRLEAPATYWQKRASKMSERGNYSLLALVFLVIIGAIIVITVFVNSPANVLPNIAKGDSNAVRWLLVSVTAISLITYGIRSLAKVMYSFYHLARDAEEREQLTHLYLALMKDDKVDKEDRSIVLQSLFSRADTGLLKDVSAPTMPGIAVDKLMKS